MRPVARSRVRTWVTTSLTSAPYAPTFWIGVAPVRPGMPDSASSPTRPEATVCSTRSSHGSPAATRSVAPEQASASVLMPRRSIRTTVPGKPSSATSRLEPPPRTSTGSCAASSSASVATSSGSEVTVTIRAAGPPTRSVVYAASETCSADRADRRPPSTGSGDMGAHSGDVGARPWVLGAPPGSKGVAPLAGLLSLTRSRRAG